MGVIGLAVSGVLLSLSALFSALVVYTYTVFQKYSPVYTPISCVSFGSEMGDMDFDENFVKINGTSVKSCHNPNPYHMWLAQAGAEAAGEVFVRLTDENGTELKSIGNSSILEVSFDANGTSNLTAFLNLSMPLMDAFELMSSDSVALIAEFRVIAKAELEYLGERADIAQEQFQVCGFEVALATQEVGDAVCAPSIDELVIPRYNESFVGEDLMTMTPEFYAHETSKKNLSFGGLMATFFGLALACAFYGVTLIRRHRRSARQPQMKKASSAADAAPAELAAANAAMPGDEMRQKAES